MIFSIDRIRDVLFQIYLALLFNIITWLIIYAQIRPSSEIIPLHYGIFYGADLIGSGYYLYLIPLFGLLLIIFNYIFYRRTRQKEELAGKMAVATALVVQLVILTAILFLKSIIVI